MSGENDDTLYMLAFGAMQTDAEFREETRRELAAIKSHMADMDRRLSEATGTYSPTNALGNRPISGGPGVYGGTRSDA